MPPAGGPPGSKLVSAPRLSYLALFISGSPFIVFVRPATSGSAGAGGQLLGGSRLAARGLSSCGAAAAAVESEEGMMRPIVVGEAARRISAHELRLKSSESRRRRCLRRWASEASSGNN